jgi:isoaspartyl peptidase/L-asparaginase-like protein (Ntn-hydrolase superfamily)
VATREELQLTSDGEANFDYASHAGAGLSFVTDQIEHAPALPLALWSPDSKRLLTHRLDQRKVREMYLLQSAPPGGALQPVLWSYRYPFPGDPAVPTVQMNIFDIESHSRAAFSGDPQLVLFDTPLELGAFRWSDDSSKVYFLAAERGLKSVRFGVADARTGAVRPILEERGATYVQTNAANVRVIGDGAEKFAKQNGFEFVPNEYFQTEFRRQQLEQAKQREAARKKTTVLIPEDHFDRVVRYGTVGCVALDRAGNLAAGTSTGGMTNKKFGRVGDAPIIGAGTYANNATCAVSATGWGEFFIRVGVARDIAAQMEYKGTPLTEAAAAALAKVAALGGDGGVICIDRDGHISMPFNTPGMYRGFKLSNGASDIEIFAPR